MSGYVIDSKEPKTKRRRLDECQKNVKNTGNCRLSVSSINNRPANKICHFEKIYQSLLCEIYREANPLDRLRAELVSKKFEWAAKKRGWTARNASQINWEMLNKSRNEMKTMKNTSVTIDHIISLLRRVGPYLCKLNLESFPNIKIVGGEFCKIFQFVLNITVLNIKHVNLEPSHLKLMAKHLAPKLKKVSFNSSFSVYIYGCKYKSNIFTQSIEAAFRRFFIVCTKLEVLNLQNEKIKCSCFDTLPTTLRSLELFSVDISNDAFISIGKRCAGHLKTLKIYSKSSKICKYLNIMLPKLTELTTINLKIWHDYQTLMPFCFVASLKHLKIHLMDAIDDDCIKSISDVCQSICSLELFDCSSLTAEGLLALAKLPNLVNLSINNVGNFSDDVFIAIAQRGILKTFKLTRSLYYGMDITDDSIHELVNCCKSLKSLKLCNDFSDPALLRLSELPKLVELDLSCETNLSDKTLKAISSNGLLKKLTIHGCENITDKSIIDVINSCKSLNYLSISNCPYATDAFNAETMRRHGVNTELLTRRDLLKVFCYRPNFENK